MLETKIKVLLWTIPLALLGALLVLTVQSTPLTAIAQSNQGTFFEEAVRSTNGTGEGTPPASSAETGPGAVSQEGERAGGESAAMGASLMRQGQISSSESEVPGRDDTQSAVIVPPRDDNAVLSGILTYHASRPVDLIVWNNVELENTTAIPEEFGDITDIVDIGGKTVALAGVGSGESGSIPFAGNAIEVVGEDQPFIVTYSLNAFPALANLVNDIQSLNAFNATAEDEGDDSDNDDEE
jgi:hypothetical protein